MKKKYNLIRNIFIQNTLSRSLFFDKIKLPTNFINLGELEYWCWRYVYMKDITKKNFTTILLKLGFDNLTTVEIITGLNFVKGVVGDILKNHEATK